MTRTAPGTFVHVSTKPLRRGTILHGYRLEPESPFAVLRTAALTNDDLLFWLIETAATRPPQGMAGSELLREMRYIMEAVFDAERQLHFPDRPSRIGAVFLFASELAAKTFELTYRADASRCYRCEVLRADNVQIFEADQGWLEQAYNTDLTDRHAIDCLRRAARSYWSGHCIDANRADERRELVVRGRVRVLDRIDCTNANVAPS